jgi:pyrroline-5-carboxylate reductase
VPDSNVPREYGVLGVGAIAGAMVTGLCDVAEPPSIVLSPRSPDRAAALAKRFPSVTVAADNQSVLDTAGTVLLCVRPQDASAVLRALAFRPDHVVISVMAGISMARLRELVALATVAARAIPLPSVATRDGITPVHPPHAGAHELFDRLGRVIDVADEGAFDALSASTATIAAHFEYLGTISGWLTGHGVPKADADPYVAAVFAGLASTLRAPNPDFESLARDHATPGGINEAFLASLRDAAMFDAVVRSLDMVAERPEPPA